MGKILLWLQERLKHWTKPAALPLTPGLLLDITRSRTDLIVENAMLRQQLIVLNRQIKRPQFTKPDHFILLFYPTLRSFGSRPFTSFSQIPCCAGIVNCFVSIGIGNRKANQRCHRKRLRSSKRWQRRMAYREQSEYAENC